MNYQNGQNFPNNNNNNGNNSNQNDLRLARYRSIILLLVIALLASVIALVITSVKLSNAIAEEKPSESESASESETESESETTQNPNEPDTVTKYLTKNPTTGLLYLLSDDHLYSKKDTALVSLETKKVNGENTGYTVADNNVKLTMSTILAMNTMFTAMESAGENPDYAFRVVAGFRTWAEQEAVYPDAPTEENTQDISLPGGSDFHSGNTFRLSAISKENGTTSYMRDIAETTEAKWLEKNMWRYGIIQRYPASKTSQTGFSENPQVTNIYRYVGIPHAYYMWVNDLCLEEYLTTVRGYTQEKPLIVTLPSGEVHKIFFVGATLANGGATLNMPEEDFGTDVFAYSYDNRGGYVVTVSHPVKDGGDVE